ncbi:MAG: acetyl-CoA carboxylase carboxyltransferase subunit alpha [Vallitalea sp.]|jgi:acetyl-CoA carboxylase carboxyl transferase alpha subunit|nr:acetyl-CoA carboxylase carboxyltransferase subunit alpha [Vallitalea sp.]
MKAWDRVIKARHTSRPTTTKYIQNITDEFFELHGDRAFKDDEAIIGGLGKIGDIKLTIIGQEKGTTIKEKLKRNFGMSSPEGYRKALRLMKQAEKFKRPILCIVDTSGAFCGVEAEERGQGESIARNLFEMSGITVPILTIIIGEGGSGGALALAVSDEVWMMENSVYSILSPEGFATILYKDVSLASQVADDMKITAQDLNELEVIEKIIEEADVEIDRTEQDMMSKLKSDIIAFYRRYQELSGEEIVNRRYMRYRKF